MVPAKKIAYTWRYDGFPGDSTVTFELFAGHQREAQERGGVVFFNFDGFLKQILRFRALPVVQIHAAPAYAGRGVFVAELQGGAEGVVGGAVVAYAPEAFGLDGGIASTFQSSPTGKN